LSSSVRRDIIRGCHGHWMCTMIMMI